MLLRFSFRAAHSLAALLALAICQSRKLGAQIPRAVDAGATLSLRPAQYDVPKSVSWLLI